MKPSAKYRKEWFNPLFFVIDELLNRGVFEFYIFGGKDSSKTHSVMQTVARLCYKNGHRALCFRKESTTIKKTLKGTVSKAIETMRLQNAYVQMDMSFKSSIDGARDEIILTGLDSPTKAKGIEGFNILVHDELNQFTWEDYNESLTAFRSADTVAYFGMWNPVSIDSFVKKRIVDTEKWIDSGLTLPSESSFVKVSDCGKKALIKTTYPDNYWVVGSPCNTYGFLNQRMIERYEAFKTIDPEYYSINVLGEWGIPKIERMYLYSFKNQRNVVPCPYREGEPLRVGLDYNVRGIATVVGQEDVKGRAVHIIDAWQEPGLTIEQSAEIFCQKFRNVRNKYVYCTGDASGDYDKTERIKVDSYGNELPDTNLGRFMEVLGKHGFLCVKIQPKGNPNTAERAAHNNVMLADGRVLIDPKCWKLVNDINNTAGLSSLRVNKPVNEAKGVGDLVDAFGYLLFYQFYEYGQL